MLCIESGRQILAARFHFRFAGFSGFKSFGGKVPSLRINSLSNHTSPLFLIRVNRLDFRSRKRAIENGDIFDFTVEKALVGGIGMISNPQWRRV